MRKRFFTFYFVRTAGQSLVELLVVMGLMALLLPTLATALVTSREGRAQEKQRQEATWLLREAREAVRSVREEGWSNFTNGTFHPAATSSGWLLSSGSESINSYTRQVVLSDVYRNSSGAVVTSGGTLDPSTKKVRYVVSWLFPYSSFVEATEYLQRYIYNTAYMQTTQADFNAGTNTGTTVVSSTGTGVANDGQLQLGAGGQGDWCSPDLTIAALDLPKNGVANAISAIEGKVFTGTGDNASGVSYATVNVANTNPPTSQLVGTFDGYKTNAIFGEANYAYLGTDNNGKEVVIVNLAQQDPVTQKYSEIGYFDASGNGSGNTVYVSGNIGYMVSNNVLRTFNLSSKSGSRPQLGSVTLAGTGTKVVVSGNYAYVAISGSSTKLQIVEVANNGATLTVVGSASPTSQSARDVVVNSTATRAYLATATSATQAEFFIIDITTKTGTRPILGSYDTSGMDPKALIVVPGNRAIIVGSNGEEYQAINVVSESNPVHCGGLQVNTGINGIATVVEADGDAYSYIITGDSSSELKIIEGGPGGQYSSSGVFESSSFNATNSAAFNRFVATVDQPSSTQIKMQVGVTPLVNGSCNAIAYTYVGPNGDPAAYFTPVGSSISAQIPMGTVTPNYQNPAQCFRYKAILTSSDFNQTPVLYDVNVNYSP
jgi:type II secretory pathway pseudopilin PulG